MEEEKISRTESAVNDDKISIPFSPAVKPVLASTVNDVGNHTPGQLSHVCAAIGEVIVVNEGDRTLAEIISDEESSGFGVLRAPSGKLSEDHDALEKDSRCSLDTELIDDNAVVSLSKVGMDSETVGKEKEKKRRRNSIGFESSEKGMKIVHSRIEVETLRYYNVEEQKKLWREIYNGFSSTVRTEYDELGSVRPQRKQSGFRGSNRGTDPAKGGENRKVCKETVDGDVEVPIPMDCACDEDYNEEEDEDSDLEIQRPAFLVEGEPDFNSGPPEDGLEYLRRVRVYCGYKLLETYYKVFGEHLDNVSGAYYGIRWEAAQIPKVKVAKLDKNKVKKEQSVYMPQIPEIESCPEHVLPLKQWEEEFLCDFSELRLAISRLDGSHNNVGAHSTSTAEETVRESTWSAGPTLYTILKMDLVGRVSMLKRQIGLFQCKDELSRNECLWLFALCAAIDTPLDADTSASLRSLLRKCSKLRAAKSELDDEAVMLNILVTISGNFFGQADNFLIY
ncbi:hypothetical protein V2J09_013278 [Rumex salicifolius]